jgi:hypothetical protein
MDPQDVLQALRQLRGSGRRDGDADLDAVAPQVGDEVADFTRRVGLCRRADLGDQGVSLGRLQRRGLVIDEAFPAGGEDDPPTRDDARRVGWSRERDDRGPIGVGPKSQDGRGWPVVHRVLREGHGTPGFVRAPPL